MADFLDFVRQRVLLLDGAMGSQIQARDLSLDDFWGQENCSEILNLSKPDLVRGIHQGYLEAGADAVETNSFGGSTLTLAEFGLEARALEINERAARLAREAVESFAGDGRQRFVVGAIGPGTKLPSLGHIGYRELEQSFTVQAEGLIAGGADVLLIETCQDPLQIKAAVNACRHAFVRRGRELPLMVQVTIETTGAMLVGTDIAAATTIVDALGVPVLGLNCATGPKEMAEHVRHLSQSWRGLISCLPNAGLPELRCGHTHYPLGPDELAAWTERFIAEDAINIVGGCCGTGVEHIRALDAMLRRIAEDGYRPAPRARAPQHTPALTSLFSAVPLAPGELVPGDRRALQRQRLEEIPPAAGGRRLGRLRRHGSRAGARGQQRARHLQRLRRPRRGRRDERGRLAHARPGRQPAGDRIRPSCRCWKRRWSCAAARRC